MPIARRGLAALVGAAALVAMGVAADVASGAPAAAAAAQARLCSAKPKPGFASCLALRQIRPIRSSATDSLPSPT